MGMPLGHEHGGCSSPQVQAMFCELLDPATAPARAQEIRRHIAECGACQSRLDTEELFREMLGRCCGGSAAPQGLRSRISISITRTQVRWN